MRGLRRARGLRRERGIGMRLWSGLRGKMRARGELLMETWVTKSQVTKTRAADSRYRRWCRRRFRRVFSLKGELRSRQTPQFRWREGWRRVLPKRSRITDAAGNWMSRKMFGKESRAWMRSRRFGR